MSTRSGKRIHGSFHESTMKVDVEPAVKSERKTRSKRVKENVDELSVSLFQAKKRNNYVSYPTDDEQNGEEGTIKGKDARQGRVLRRNTLKDQNIVHDSDKTETLTEPENLIRKTRRGKKNAEEQAENLENVQDHVIERPKSKKIKKKAEVIVDEGAAPVLGKKSKRKKKRSKQSNSMVVEDVKQDGNSKNNTFNKSMSMESFHSAAGSPVKMCDDEEPALLGFGEDTTFNNHVIDTTLSKRKSSIGDITDRHESTAIDADTTLQAINSRKSISQDTTFQKNSMSIVNSTNIFDTDEDTNSITSNNSKNEVAKRRSNINNGTFDESTKIINITSEKETAYDDKKDSTYDKDVNKTVDTTFEKDTGSTATPKKKKSSVKDTTFEINAVPTPQKSAEKSLRKSNIKDTTFDNNDEIKDTAFEKDTVAPPRSAKKSLIRKSSIKDTTFDSNEKVDDTTFEKDTDSSTTTKKKKSSFKDTTFERDEVPTLPKSANMSLRKSNIKDTTYDKSDNIEDTTFEKDTVAPRRSAKKSLTRQSSIKDTTFDSNEKVDDTTFEKDTNATPQRSAKKSLSRESIVKDNTIDKSDNIDDTTFEKDTKSTPLKSFKKNLKESITKNTNIMDSSVIKVPTRKSIKDSTFEKSIISDDDEIPNSAKKRKSNRFDTYRNDTTTEKYNTTFKKDLNTEFEGETKRKSLQNESKLSINDQGRKLNSTYERNSKSSLISSDNSEIEKSNISCISITSDESENLMNTTPVLVESSMDNSGLSKDSPTPQTLLKREGTFTKDAPEVIPETPPKESLPLAGCYTPYHVTRDSQKRVLNVTRSIEKHRLSSEPAPRMTRVMFCSPVDNPAAGAAEKRKIIKSNLKGSNKSFVFDDSVSGSSALPRAAPRKRSYTHSEADSARVKRSRLAGDLQHSVDRLARPRTSSAAAKLTEPTTPSKKPLTPKSKCEAKSSRTKLPNFAALHQRQFSKMESLGECQERRARRARQLLTPNGAVAMLERISPKDTTTEPQKPKEQPKKTDTPTKLPTLESLRPGFTRFGFKLNLDVNPFSVPSKQETKPNGLKPALPSLAGATSVRREVAKQAVMREKSFTDRRNAVKRNENRTIIKGVRTNRRFELQMKMRNVE